MLDIDQHALHERILFEQLKERFRAGTLEAQKLLIPEPVELSAEQAAKEHTTSSRKGVVGADRSSFDELKRRSVEVVELSDGEKAAFKTATRPVHEKWAQTVGAALVKKAEEAVAKRQA